MTRPHRKTDDRQAASSTARRVLIGTAVVAVAFGGWLMVGRGPDFAGEAATLQRRLLDETATVRSQREALSMLMRHVDKLDSESQRKLKDEVRQEWRDVQRKDMDAFFAAADAERQQALDRALDRLQMIAELDEAFSPGGMRVRRPRPQAGVGGQPPRPQADRPRDAGGADRRQAIEAYAAALEKRARERGIDFSLLRRRVLRG